MLAGSTRIRLLRELHDRPGQNIATLANAIGISRPFASQEMRRIQSRGLLKATHRGASLVYGLGSDPQVPSAATLLKAVQKALDSLPPRRDGEMTVIATGLAHERRIALVCSLMTSPKTSGQLLAGLPMSRCSYDLHVRTLTASGFVAKNKAMLVFKTPAHPLGKALVECLRKEPLG